MPNMLTIKFYYNTPFFLKKKVIQITLLQNHYNFNYILFFKLLDDNFIL